MINNVLNKDKTYDIYIVLDVGKELLANAQDHSCTLTLTFVPTVTPSSGNGNSE